MAIQADNKPREAGSRAERAGAQESGAGALQAELSSVRVSGAASRPRRFKWLWAVLVLAPLELGAKGCDSAVVGNDCQKDANGKVGAECPQPDSDVCGGLQGLTCDKGEYCKFPVSAQCGAADQTGTCSPIQTACTKIYQPVCGCDDKTYGNECEAAAAGVSVAYASACKTDPPPAKTCGGLLGQSCSKGEFCSFDVSAQCGAADQTGTCQALPEACDLIYAPVCGCDGKTYGNLCEANAAGVSAAAKGECQTDPEPNAICGGLTGAACRKGEFCSFPPDTKCGSGDQTGVCAPTPTACREIYQPVCGCDGKTYGNECEANAAGISVASKGECNPGPDPSVCGGLLGAQCGKGEFCNYPPDALCGAADQTGKCAALPSACTDIYQPVCGCDGKTYGNECTAHAAGVSVAKAGECESDPNTGKVCGGLLGIQCNKGEYCDFPIETQCGSGDQTGTCRTPSVACDAVLDPVCGCDGKTYSSACEASQVGISVAAKGECKTEPAICGGLRGLQCADGEYCNYPQGALCGRADATGECAPIPRGCTKESNPVCGCDGQTYGNPCMAAAAGVSVEFAGTCKTAGVACGSRGLPECATNEFCSYPASAICGAADAPGVCTRRPEGCTAEYRPVCGCDGTTYGNACEAASKGVSVASTGACAS